MQTVSSKTGRTFVLPTESEDKALTKTIQEDGDDFEASKAWFERAHPGHPRTRGRPVGTTSAQTKAAFSIRVEPELLEAMRATGKGWQSRVELLLKKEFMSA